MHEAVVWSVVAVALFALVALAFLVASLLRTRRHTRRLERELAHAVRFALAGQLGATATQALARALSGICGKASTARTLLQQQDLHRSELQRLVSEVVDESARGIDEVQRLAALTVRKDTGPEPFDLHQLLGETVRLLEPEAQRRDIEVMVQPNALRTLVVADRLQIQQVLVQLLLTAMEGMERTAAGLRRVVVATHDAPPLLQVQVSDRRNGLYARNPEAMFAPCYTTRGGETQLGLHVARAISEAHAGGLHARRRAGGGAVFTLAIPSREVAPAWNTAARATARVRAGCPA